MKDLQGLLLAEPCSRVIVRDGDEEGVGGGREIPEVLGVKTLEVLG
jgi:hypothetical protein